jgi:hypothetical protein
MRTIAKSARSDLVRRALRLEWLTAAWMLVEAAVAIGSGVAAHSLSLIAFGADSLIKLASTGTQPVGDESEKCYKGLWPIGASLTQRNAGTLSAH